MRIYGTVTKGIAFVKPEHIKSLRLRVRDQVIVIDEKGIEYLGEVKSINKGIVKIRRYEGKTTEEEKKILICFGILKRRETDEVVKKLCDIGVSEIYPFLSSHCSFSPPPPEKRNSMHSRWVRIARESSQVTRLPATIVKPLMTFEEVLEKTKNTESKFIFWEKADRNIESLLNLNKEIKTVCLVIGPEGGFSEREIREAGKNGFVKIGLGRKIMKSNIFSIYVASIVDFLINR